jgi:adenylate cyclase
MMKRKSTQKENLWHRISLVRAMHADWKEFDPLRPWRLISLNNIFIIYLSILVFAIYALARHGLHVRALLTSLIVSIPVGYAIAFAETQAAEFRRQHRRYPFFVYLLLRTLRVTVWFIVLFIIIMSIVHAFNLETGGTIFPVSPHQFFTTSRVFEFLGIALGIALVANFLDELHRKLGKDALFNLVLGKYHQIIQEERIFLFIDLNSSTEIAEAMGELEFSHFLQDFYYDISEPIARYQGRVYQYVGDEMVVTWPAKKGLKDGLCLRCFFAVERQIRQYEKNYLERYGRLPCFKASLHGGSVVVSEVGKYKSEIAYHGDVLNTTARMLNKCHDMSSTFIVSDWVCSAMQLPPFLLAEPLGRFQLKGKQQEMELFSITHSKMPAGKFAAYVPQTKVI